MKTTTCGIKRFLRIAVLTVFGFVSFCTFQSTADVIILSKGQVITGKVIQQDSDGTLVQLDYGTVRYPPSWIKDIKRDESAAIAETPSNQRIPSWGQIVSALAKREWAHELKQIPATVIDTGVLKNVPYISFRCASGVYELNIYGDLDNPAGVEIGVVNYLLKDVQAKSNCVELLSAVLARDDDKKIVSNLKWTKDIVKTDGLTFETTLPTETDAYGGWWVSVYDEKALDQARASGPEILAISQPIVPQKTQPPVVSSATTTSIQTVTPVPATEWSRQDLSYARPRISSSTSSVSSGDRVYVRGYYRKDGTYVHSYTRSHPHRR